jgi:hypothetical protein
MEIAANLFEKEIKGEISRFEYERQLEELKADIDASFLKRCEECDK